MQNDEQGLGAPYNTIGLLRIDWVKKHSTGRTMGTAFPVGDGSFVVTASHLIRGNDLVSVELHYKPPGGDWIAAKWVSHHGRYMDPGNSPTVYDVAVIKLAAPVQGALRLRSLENGLPSQNCSVAGYVNQALTVGNVTLKAWPQQGQDYGGALKFQLGSTRDGMSGGPVVCNGEVVGVISGDNTIDDVAVPLASGNYDAPYTFITRVTTNNRPDSSPF